jgi:uncharacterized repeat protein (TIGR03803 family)
MKSQATTRQSNFSSSPITAPTGRKPGLALFLNLPWAIVLVLSAVYAEAGVVVTNLHLFQEGVICQAGLVQASDGNFYGTTSGNDVDQRQFGSVFKISSNGVLTILYSFTNGSDGAYPMGGLVQDSDGGFYGTTLVSGSNGGGTVYKISAAGALTTVCSFPESKPAGLEPMDGVCPEAGLVRGSDGAFYGTTGGALFAHGSVFRLTVEPAFQAMTLSSGTLNLNWNTEPGGKYQLQYSHDLNSTNWTNLSDVATAAGASLTAKDSVTNDSQRFYRLVLSR